MNTDMTMEIMNKIVSRQFRLYDSVYFYGDRAVTTQFVDKLLIRYCRRNPEAKVCRVNAGAFRRETLENIRNGVASQLPQCDMFVFEDVEEIAGCQANEQRLYGVLDHLLENGRQILVCGAVPTAQMENLAPRIRAQLDGAICLHLNVAV